VFGSVDHSHKSSYSQIVRSTCSSKLKGLVLGFGEGFGGSGLSRSFMISFGQNFFR